jgi:hypothetical protein
MKFELWRRYFMDIKRVLISSCFNKLVFDAQFEFQRLMVISVRIVEADFEF